MRMGMWVVLAALAVAPGMAEAAPAASPPAVSAATARDAVGRAVLSAVQAHMALAKGDYKAGRGALETVRRELKAAVAASTPEQTRDMLETMTALSALEEAVWAWDKKAVARSRKFSDALLDLYDRHAAKP